MTRDREGTLLFFFSGGFFGGGGFFLEGAGYIVEPMLFCFFPWQPG